MDEAVVMLLATAGQFGIEAVEDVIGTLSLAIIQPQLCGLQPGELISAHGTAMALDAHHGLVGLVVAFLDQGLLGGQDGILSQLLCRGEITLGSRRLRSREDLIGHIGRNTAQLGLTHGILGLLQGRAYRSGDGNRRHGLTIW